MPHEPDKKRARVPRPSARQQSVKQWNRPSYAGYTPQQLKRVLTDVKKGILDTFAELASNMLREDGHIRALNDTRVLAVSAADWTINPADETPDAIKAADLVRDSLNDTPNLEEVFAHLLFAEALGWANAEHRWMRRHGQWHSVPHLLHGRDARFAEDWSMQLRTWTEPDPESVDVVEALGTSWWISIDGSNPNSFISHVPGGIGETPNLSGDLHAVAWTWLFKRYMRLFRQDALEIHANPFIYGVYSPGSTDEAQDALFEGLENMSGDHRAVFEALSAEGGGDGGDPIRVIQTTAAGKDHTDAINAMNAEMSKALLGSTLNVEVGDTGGNRALGESQVSTTILPRYISHGRRLASTLESDWFAPLLRLNAHLFSSTPAVPRIEFVLTQETPPVIEEMHINAGVIEQDELRTSAGVEPWGDERGKQIAKLAPAAGAPAFASEVADPAVPFPRGQLSLPLTRPRRRTSRTPSTSPSQIERVPID